MAGGKAAVPRKVVASGYDWEDRMILNMKQQGFTNVQIAQKLIAEGGTRYDPKSIGSRWLKMRRVRAQHDEGLLDDDLSDWHIGDVRFPQHPQADVMLPRSGRSEAES